MLYDPENNLQDRSQWIFAFSLAILAINKTPIQKVGFSREQLYFRDSTDVLLVELDNKSFDELDFSTNQAMRDYLRKINYYRPNSSVYPKVYLNQLIYLKNAASYAPGQNKAFLPSSKGPLRVTSFNDANHCGTATDIADGKKVDFHVQDVIFIKHLQGLQFLFSEDWDKLLV